MFTVGVAGAAQAWTPNTTPIYSLGEDDFIVQESSVGTYLGVTPGGPALRMGAGPITGGFTDDPVHITRSTPADAMNMVQLEASTAALPTITSVTEAFDQGSIDLYGVRRDTSVKAQAIVDPYLRGADRGAARAAAPAALPQHLFVSARLEIHPAWSRWIWCRSPTSGSALQAITVRITVDRRRRRRHACRSPPRIGSARRARSCTRLRTRSPTLAGCRASAPAAAPRRPIRSNRAARERIVAELRAAAPSVNTPFILEPTAELLAAQGHDFAVHHHRPVGRAGWRPTARTGAARVYVSLDGDTFAPSASSSGARRWATRPPIAGAAGPHCRSIWRKATAASTASRASRRHRRLAMRGADSGRAARIPELHDRDPDRRQSIRPDRALSRALRHLRGRPAGRLAIPVARLGIVLLRGAADAVCRPGALFRVPELQHRSAAARRPLSETTIYSYVPVGSSVIPGTLPGGGGQGQSRPERDRLGHDTARQPRCRSRMNGTVVVTDQHQPIEQRRLVQQDDDNPLESS